VCARGVITPGIHKQSHFIQMRALDCSQLGISNQLQF
jgi:hypothetical protein